MRQLAVPLLVLTAVIGIAGAASSTRTVMPWMCLERCNATAADIAASVKEFTSHAHTLTAVSFEDYNLGPHSTLVVNNLTHVAGSLQKAGLMALPMISSYPYPPQFLSWMREVWANPTPFINDCLSKAAAQGFSGFNVDWEPASGTITPQDPLDYAAFLSTFADALHAQGMILTVDVASWSHIWNYTAIAASSVDRMMVMSTYTSDFTTFKQQLQLALASIPLEKLSVGMMTTKGNTNQTFTTAELQQRFDVLRQAQVRHVSIWKAPIPANWWPFLDDFVANASSTRWP